MADLNRQVTGSDAVNQTLKAMGLPTYPDVAGSTEQNAVQMWQLATDVGQELMLGDYKWNFLDRDFTINTTPGVSSYALPSDFSNFASDSMWNRTTRMPAVGSLQDYEWSELKARNLAGTTFTMLFRVTESTVEFFEVPSTTQEIVLPYTSRAWAVAATGDPKDNLTQNDDVVLYEPLLFKCALRRAWMMAKGFDTTKINQTFSDLLSNATSNDKPGRTISIGRPGGFPYLSVLNIPDTGYGA